MALKFGMVAGSSYHNISLGQGQDVVAQEKLENGHRQGECSSRLLPRFGRLPVAPHGSQWLLLIQTHAVCGSLWLPMAPCGSLLKSLPNHYP